MSSLNIVIDRVTLFQIRLDFHKFELSAAIATGATNVVCTRTAPATDYVTMTEGDGIALNFGLCGLNTGWNKINKENNVFKDNS